MQPSASRKQKFLILTAAPVKGLFFLPPVFARLQADFSAFLTRRGVMDALERRDREEATP